VWLLAITGVVMLGKPSADDALARQAIIVAVAALLTAAVSWIGWSLLISPGRRLRFRAAALAYGEDRTLRKSTTRDELQDLDRSLSRLGERLTRQEAQIQREQRTLRAMLDSQGEPMIAVDPSGLVAICNAAAEQFLSVGAGSLAGRSLRSYLTSARLLQALETALSGRTFRGRITVPTESGERTWDCAAAPLPLPGHDNPGALLSLRDVTELANAVRIKTDFVANASHELRTPLAAIRGAVETLQTEAGENPKIAARMREIIAGHVNRLEGLVQDLLDLSRVESGEAALRIEPLVLDMLRRSILDQFEETCAARGVRIHFDIPDALDGWRTDPRLVVLILRNLVENASKFAHDNTEIRIVGRIERSETEVVRFEVRDKGIGIPLAQQQRVFERFYQVDPARPGYEQLSSIGRAKRGTGLGLAIVRHAVKALGGRVGIQSIYTQGTTVWFEVPFTLPDDLPQEAVAEFIEEDDRFIDEPDQPPTGREPDEENPRTTPENPLDPSR
jgi:two-component system phosphate regulon sensor histidine kinase PhoR